RWHPHKYRPAAPAMPLPLRVTGRVRVSPRSQRKTLQFWRQLTISKARAALEHLFPFFLVPQLEFVALTREHHALLEARVSAQRRRYQYAAGGIHHDIFGMADQQALQIANARIEAGQSHQFLLDRLPVGQRINQQAFVGVGSDHQPPRTARVQRFAITRRHRETAFAVETDMRYTAEHGPSLSMGRKSP